MAEGPSTLRLHIAENPIDAFFRDVYKSEVEEVHKLHAVDTLLVFICTALTGAAVYLLRNGPWDLMSCPIHQGDVLLSIVATLTMLFFFCLVGAAISTILSQRPGKKAFLAPMKELDRYATDLQVYNEYYNKLRDPSPITEKEFLLAARSQYIKAGEINRVILYRKAAWQVRAKLFVSACVASLILVAVPLHISLRQQSESRLQPAATAASHPPAIPSKPAQASAPTSSPASSSTKGGSATTP